MRKGIMHCHSELSQFDSPMSVKRLCERAKECGYDSVTLTDHGTMAGIDNFIEAAHEVGIKPIPGVEAYVQEDDEPKKAHLLLLAKDLLGYKALSKAVTMSYHRVDDYGFPRMNMEILKECFGPDSEYHGHVYATSACMGGVLGQIILKPMNIMQAIEKEKKRQSEYVSPEDDSAVKYKEYLSVLETKIADLKERKKNMVALAKKPYKKKENALKKLKDTPEYKAAAAALMAEKQESADAAKAAEKMTADIAGFTAEKKGIAEVVKKNEVLIAKFNLHQEKINDLNKELNENTGEVVFNAAVEKAKEYDELFGHGNFFIELQYHGYMKNKKIPAEEIVMVTALKIANETNIPICAGNDAHIPDNSDTSIRARQILMTLRYASKGGKSTEVEDADKELYVKPEAEFKQFLCRIFPEVVVNEAILNTYEICENCNFEYERKSHYPKFPIENGTAADKLRELVNIGIEKKFPGRVGFNEEYEVRIEHELNTIISMGYADYFLIEQDFLSIGRRLGYLSEKSRLWLKDNLSEMTAADFEAYVDAHNEEPGFSVGPGRGSGAGSLVAYVLGITNMIDPIKYDLLFERFLNPDRVSMPDIDTDFSDEVRDLTIEYCRKKYGRETVAKILTSAYMMPKGAIRKVGSVLAIERGNKDYWLKLSDELTKLVPNVLNIRFTDHMENIVSAQSGDPVTVLDYIKSKYQALPDDTPYIASRKKDAIKLLDDAASVEGVFINPGTHAAGVIIADGKPLSDYLPLKTDESGALVVQCDMVQAEGIHGLLKFDFLGLKNLQVITATIRSIKNRLGKEIDPLQLTFDDPKIYSEIFSKGATTSVFQFESDGMKDLLRSFKPSCFEDIIAMVSLYRPGPIDSIPQYIDAKYHPESIKYLVPELENILKNTYGVTVYQEQVMSIFQKLAGYSLAQADNVRRFMSKKKMDKLVHERDAFINGDSERNIPGCVSNGIPADKANELFDQMVEFAKYAFNKSHAAVYSAVSYITAWLKYYYPEDYMANVLNFADNVDDYYPVFESCKEMNIKILRPDINLSTSDFVPLTGAIRFGLNSVKGTRSGAVGDIINECKNNGPYASLVDFLKRVCADKTTIENLIKAGAFDTFCVNRNALLKAYPKMSEILEKIEAVTETISRLGVPTDEKTENALEKAKKKYEELNNQFSVLYVDESTPEDYRHKLIEEKRTLGFFISGHLLDHYRSHASVNCTEVKRVNSTMNMVNIMGVVQDLRVITKNGKTMAFFSVEDKSGSIPVKCFSEAYAESGLYIEENEVLIISGKVSVAYDEFAEKEVISVIMRKAKTIAPDLPPIIVSLKGGMYREKELTDSLKKDGLISDNGHPLLLYDMLEDEVRTTKLYIKEEVLESKFDYDACIK